MKISLSILFFHKYLIYSVKYNMIPTPYLKKLKTQGGTLYVFPSVSRDLTRTLVSNDYEFKFSHFACLNLPDIKSGEYSDGCERGLYLDTLFEKNNGYPTRMGESSDTMGVAITENLQNYVMNFETSILNGMGDNDDYDDDILTSVSEKVFWNWMQKVGAIKFNDTDTAEDYNNLQERTVVYLGSLDIMNTVEINGDIFEELYIHVPSTAGASTDVYFRRGEMTDNKNYLNKNYSVSGEGLVGRDTTSNRTPEGLYNKALYDIDNGINCYKGDVGHTIDFRDSSYAGGDGISTMNGNSLNDFEFNAVLIYYDLYEKTSTPGVRRVATNLYGILFLEEVKDENLGGDIKGYFQRYPKKRETVYGNGNSYALKLDFKVDTIGDTTYPEPINSSINENEEIRDHVVAMTLYTRALEQLQNCIDFFFTQKNELVKLSERIATLENTVMGIDTVASLKQDINRLYDLCDSNAIVDVSALLGLIDANTKKLDNIMNGGKDLKLQFDTDVLQPGVGIGMEKSQNKVVISSEQRYSINTVIDGNDSTGEVEITDRNPVSTVYPAKYCKMKLKPGENFAVIYIRDEGDSETNFKIDVDDKECGWEVGQSLKIHFVCDEGELRFAEGTDLGFVIKVTDGVILNVPGFETEGNNLIEIICVAEGKFIYLIK